jgi:hypothetical protein
MKLTETLGRYVTANQEGGLFVLVYSLGICILAFDLTEDKAANFAGFAVSRKRRSRMPLNISGWAQAPTSC